MAKRLIQNRNKSKTDFRTPQYIFEGAMNHFNVMYHLDVAASCENRLCNWYFTEEVNALEQHWWGRVWCNPPYNKIGPWVDKAIDELENGTCSSVTFLLPASTCTMWFEKLWSWVGCTEVVFLSGRIRYEGPNISGGGNATNPSVLVHLERGVRMLQNKPKVNMINIRNGVWG
jgi:phage N-6-adenine-methyltransferase